MSLRSNLVLSIFKTKIRFRDEALPAFPWLARTGRAINQPFGYTFDGFYTEADVAAIYTGDGVTPAGQRPAIPLYGLDASGAGGIQPGDLKYRDLKEIGRASGREQVCQDV